MKCVKRKSTNSKTPENESEDSDYEEILPSNKRQRISIGAMQKLFARFSLSDEPSANKSPNSRKSKIKHSSTENKFRLFGGHSTSNFFKLNNNESSIPNRNEDEESPKLLKETDREKLLGTKRHADEDNDATVDKSMPQQKRVRHLKRGLRLCSNITCYIEQIIYS